MKIDFFEYLVLLAKYRWLLVRNFLLIVVLAVVISLIWPFKYKATASFIPAYDVATPFSELQASETFDLGYLLEGPVDLMSDIYAEVMKSRTVMEQVIKANKLQSRYKRKSMEDAVRYLERNSSIVVNDQKLVVLTIHAPDPQLAAAVANSWMMALDSFNQSAIRKQGIVETDFIRTRREQINASLTAVSDTLASFESQHRVFADSQEIASTIQIYGDVYVQLLQKEIMLMKWRMVGENLAITQELKSDVKNLQRQLAQFDYDSKSGIVSKDPLSKLPMLLAQHARYDRQKQILTTLEDYLHTEEKISSLKATTDTPTIIIIDRAVPPERRSWPARARIVIFSALAALFFNMVLVMAIENAKLKWEK